VALSLEPAHLAEELSYAKAQRKQRLSALDELIASYHSPFYSESGEKVKYNPENHAYQYATLVVPHLVYANPRVRVQAMAYGVGEKIAATHKHILNNWSQATNLKEILTQQAHDALFAHAVALVSLEEDWQNPISSKKAAMNPAMYRVSPRLFLIDPYATSRNEARFMGHEWVIDKADLLAMAEDDTDGGWRTQAIKDIPEDYQVDQLSTRPKDGPSRKEIVCVDLWIRDLITDDADPKEGFNGTWLTLAWGQEADVILLRDPRPAFVPPRGPYSICDFSYVPDRPIGLAPLVAVEGQVRELNKLTRRMNEMAMAYRRPIFVDDNDQNLAAKVLASGTDMVVPITGFDKTRVVAEDIGGVSQQVITHVQLAQDRLSRNSSFYEIQRGGAGQGNTATEVAMANAATDVRMNHMKSRFDAFAREVLENVSWFYYYEPDSRATLNREVLEDIGIDLSGIPDDQIAVEYQGGEAESMPNVNWHDLAIEIEPMSMGFMSGQVAQKRAMDLIAITGQLVQLQALVPGADLTELATIAGEALNVPNLGKIAGIDKVREQGGIQQQQGPLSSSGGGSGVPLPGQEMGADLASIMRP
jgi:hypothetical protein